MTSNPPPPIIPNPDDEDVDAVLGDDDQPLDPDLNDELINSHEADERAATEGRREGSQEE